MSTYYLGQTSDGRIVSRKSTRSDFTHAAMATGSTWGLPSFSTSAQGAARNFDGSHREGTPREIVELRKVDGKEFRAAMAGINPKTGRPR